MSSARVGSRSSRRRPPWISGRAWSPPIWRSRLPMMVRWSVSVSAWWSRLAASWVSATFCLSKEPSFVVFDFFSPFSYVIFRARARGCGPPWGYRRSGRFHLGLGPQLKRVCSRCRQPGAPNCLLWRKSWPRRGSGLLAIPVRLRARHWNLYNTRNLDFRISKNFRKRTKVKCP
jgi:hypothetical protein